MSDAIIIKGLELSACHGVFADEKQNPQLFVLDIILSLSLESACESDDLNDTVSYAEVCETVCRVMTENCCNLIEHAAQLVCDAIFKEYPMIEAVDLTLKKPEAPVGRRLEYPAVRVSRTRK